MQQLDPVDAGGPGGFKNIGHSSKSGVVRLPARCPVLGSLFVLAWFPPGAPFGTHFLFGTVKVDAGGSETGDLEGFH